MKKRYAIIFYICIAASLVLLLRIATHSDDKVYYPNAELPKTEENMKRLTSAQVQDILLAYLDFPVEDVRLSFNEKQELTLSATADKEKVKQYFNEKGGLPSGASTFMVFLPKKLELSATGTVEIVGKNLNLKPSSIKISGIELGSLSDKLVEDMNNTIATTTQELGLDLTDATFGDNEIILSVP